MRLDAMTRRRWVGGLALAAALGLLVTGQTILRGRLDGLGFIIYWLACFGFTALAVMMALLDARALRGQSRQEQRDLLEHTLEDIKKEARMRAKKNPRR
jgi:membrane protein implicated in regulation of membrane protease activity